MRTWLVQDTKADGDPTDALHLVDRPEPDLPPDGVLVEMKAAALNYRDHIVLRGGYARNDRRGVVPLSDGAGVVAAVGPAVKKFAVGDRVVNTFFRDWVAGEPDEAAMHSAYGGGIDGVLAERVAFPAHALLPVPAHLSFVQAATLPCAAVTAWQALVTKGNLTPGQTVLCLGTGGVSVFALQFAVLHGAVPVVTSSSDEKLERAKRLGAVHTVNYRTTPDWDDAVKNLTGGRGVDHVVEVGGPGTLEKSLACTALNGRVALIGVLTGTDGAVNPLPALFNRLSIDGIYVGSRAMFESMNRAITAAKLEPVVDRTFGFEEVKEAYRYQKSGAHFGKIVIHY